MDFEKKLQRFYENVLGSGMTAIDVGAHAGRHAYEMARLVAPMGPFMRTNLYPRCSIQ